MALTILFICALAALVAAFSVFAVERRTQRPWKTSVASSDPCSARHLVLGYFRPGHSHPPKNDSDVSAVADRPPRDSDDWRFFHAQDVPAGRLEIFPTAGSTPVQLAIDDPEQSAVSYLHPGVNYSTLLKSPETLMFQVQNDPSDECIWTPDEENPEPVSDGHGFSATWDFGDAGTFRFVYGRPTWTLPPHPIRCEVDQQPFGRGFCSVAHGSDPESWVRGKAALNTADGTLTMWMQLETDSVGEGPKGTVDVELRDSSNTRLYEVHLGEAGIGGKSPGLSRIETISAQKTVPMQLVMKTASIETTAHHTGTAFGPFGFDFLGKFTNKIEVTYTAPFPNGGQMHR
jgi:hypothetical protein